MLRAMIGAVGACLLIPSFACAAERQPLDLPLWSVAPFVGLLLAIAVLPLVAEHWWHSNWRKAIVVVAFAVPVAGFLALTERPVQPPPVATLVGLLGSPGAPAALLALPLCEQAVPSSAAGSASLLHALSEYGDFILLLAALYVVSGGILLNAQPRPTPLVNTCFLGVGAVLANLIGTTGASMILIRPVLRINQARTRNRHVPIFFIFAVSNVGGLLTPLGDPPLFLGFLRGVDFFWTLRLWPQWLMVNGSVLLLFFLWDSVAYLREGHAIEANATQAWGLHGKINLLLLLAVLAAVLLQSEKVSDAVNRLAAPWLPGFNAHLAHPRGMYALAGIALLSLLLTPRGARRANEFTWGPIAEVAVLFAGIFVTMVPALELLSLHGRRFGLTEPWQFFWLTGGLSAFLDNAPTYLTFATLAAQGRPVGDLMTQAPSLLAAISCGAVFFGAMTYIGNGPNFMVKAIAEDNGYAMPSFLGYLLYSCLVLLPIFGLACWLFFA